MEGALLAVFAALILLGICMAAREEVEEESAQLQARLIAHEAESAARDPIARRVEVAVQVAREGFRLCTHCNFTNPKRATACVMCGVSFSKSNAPAEGEVTQPPTSRQSRVQKRKEWARHVTEEGDVVWQYTPTALSRQTLVIPAYVLQSELLASSESHSSLTPAESVDAECSLAETEEGTVESSATMDFNQDTADDQIEIVVPIESLSQVAHALEDELQLTPVKIVATSEADAVQPAFSRVNSRSMDGLVRQEAKDSINNAALDFPTKLAQYITSSSTMFLDPSYQDKNKAHVMRPNRSTLLQDSVAAVAVLTPVQVRAALRVEFVGEQGIDAGGVYREWFLLVSELMAQPEAGMFACVNAQDQSFYLNPHSKEILGESHLVHILVAGRLLGRALLEGNVTGFHLALPLLKIILGLPVGFDDLEHFDPEMHRSLQWLLENSGVDALDLDFTVTEKHLDGTVEVVELVPGGGGVMVTDANKLEYVDRKLKYVLFERVSGQLFAFLKGVYEVVSPELLMPFDAEELDYILSGSDEINVDDWKRHTQVSASLATHPALVHFWTCVRKLSAADKQRLLQFATGTTRVPPGGFSALTSYDCRLCPFSLHGVDPVKTRGYIGSHACFNRLEVPLHSNRVHMEMAITAAISNRSVGFTTS